VNCSGRSRSGFAFSGLLAVIHGVTQGESGTIEGIRSAATALIAKKYAVVRARRKDRRPHPHGSCGTAGDYSLMRFTLDTPARTTRSRCNCAHLGHPSWAMHLRRCAKLPISSLAKHCHALRWGSTIRSAASGWC